MTNDGRERGLAFAGSAVAASYLAWLGVSLTLAAGRFGELFEGMGATVPAPTRYIVDHRVLIFAAVFGLSAAAVLGKEAVVRDKRISMMLTMLAVIVIRWVADVALVLCYLPLFDLIGKLA